MVFEHPVLHTGRGAHLLFFLRLFTGTDHGRGRRLRRLQGDVPGRDMHPPGAKPRRERVAPDTAGGTSTATDGDQVEELREGVRSLRLRGVKTWRDNLDGQFRPRDHFPVPPGLDTPTAPAASLGIPFGVFSSLLRGPRMPQEAGLVLHP